MLDGKAPDRLLDTYDDERVYAADENILNSTRATDFITPKSEVSRTFRDAVLLLAKDHPFARKLVNSGRLSLPATLVESPLNTPDRDEWSRRDGPGRALHRCAGHARGQGGLAPAPIGRRILRAVLHRRRGRPARARGTRTRRHRGQADRRGAEGKGLAAAARRRGDRGRARVGRAALRRRPGTCYLIRPDQHVCARWRQLDRDRLRAALARATCNT